MSRNGNVVPDRWLLRDMVHGDARAAGELRRRHDKSLYALAYGVLWDADIADAVVARVFAQAERTGREFETESGTVFGWLSRITRLYTELAAAPPLREMATQPRYLGRPQAF